MRRIEVYPYSKLYEQMGQPVTVGDSNIALFKLSNGEVHAIENRSPHPKGGILSEGLVSGHYVFCPLYDWKISLLDGLVQSPDTGSVKKYEVEVEDNKVYILLD
ncbi:MAG: nitrite reductase small subunit NirD [Cytobacillus gottheilii]|uniref:nitrite reductase small subunit NirD n=1 Tax=Cytobacillus gottheilii TaxID=859144 RepID=UPI00082C8DE5|nr:nitrite reductase small subunit NirD [Cytobacillus gottheilii]